MRIFGLSAFSALWMQPFWNQPRWTNSPHMVQVRKCCVPLKPMVLLIIIPMKNGYFIGNINPTFSDKPIWCRSPLPKSVQVAPGTSRVKSFTFGQNEKRSSARTSAPNSVMDATAYKMGSRIYIEILEILRYIYIYIDIHIIVIYLYYIYIYIYIYVCN